MMVMFGHGSENGMASTRRRARLMRADRDDPGGGAVPSLNVTAAAAIPIYLRTRP
jgi:hypothetical protein